MNLDNNLVIMRDSSLREVLVPLPSSDDCEAAMDHAVLIALRTRADLRLLSPSGQFPSLRERLERWEILPKNSRPSQVKRLGLKVKKRTSKAGASLAQVAAEADRKKSDLVVLSQNFPKPFWSGWFGKKKEGQPLHCPSLIVPPRCRFVNSKGELQLETVISSGEESALGWLASLVRGLQLKPGRILLTSTGTLPTELQEWTVTEQFQSDAFDLVRRERANLLLLPIAEGLTEALLERILQESPCPVLVVRGPSSPPY